MSVDALDLTRKNQRDASDPRASAWVIANAGAGKTHVLTQRVIRLLLAGVDPASILCLTFTKVAAAEMSRRVFGTLGGWTTLDEAKLAAEIAVMEGRPATANEMRMARTLFARALETPGGLKIQTIHAFCERLLHEFPFEANVPGQFAVMDDSAAAATLSRARAAVMNSAADEPASRLRRAVRRLAEENSDQQIDEALDALIGNRDALRRWIDRTTGEGEHGGVDDALADLRRRLALADGETEDSICKTICGSLRWSAEICRDLAQQLRSIDADAAAALQAIGAAVGETAEARFRLAFHLTPDNKVGWKLRNAQRRFTAVARRAGPDLEGDFETESQRALALAKRLDLVRAYEATAALLVVGDAILAAYHIAKRNLGALDFEDLIAKARNLLSRADAAQWVLYKLDRRVEHILVDEAQDTSPDQWMVVQSIAEDFFSGEGASRTPRTVFAVGDDKQSIFSFQGAAPEKLVEMQGFFAAKIKTAGMTFVERPLSLSFRSTQEVLTAVDTVFGEALATEITASTYAAHSSNRPNEPGHVVLLPRAIRQKKEEPEDWTEPYDAPSAAETVLANTIADEILRIRDSVLPSGKRLREGGILILVRRRDAFAAAMNRALRARKIATAGADRIPVSTHIAVLDLLALADAMLLPEDDLQLAACLKSPLLGLSESGLMQLATGRERSLWSVLLDAKDEPFAGIAAKLRRWRGMADRVPPFRFFATILGPDGGRKAFRARLGGEADDVLDTFLSQALAYEATEPPSLQGFVRFIRANESDIRRDTEAAVSGVRIMTVHGAKGLEADVVFLADTGGAAVVAQQRSKLVDIGEGRHDPAFLWRRNQPEAPDIQRAADGVEDQKTEREYLRLLYVAMTRARDVLYVAGVRLIRPPPRSWYTIVADALVPETERDPDGELLAPFKWPRDLRPPRAPAAAEIASDDRSEAPPDWLRRPAPSPVLPPEPLRPSSALAEPEAPPFVATVVRDGVDADGALLRGRLLHLLLQVLPGLLPLEWRAAADRLLIGELAQSPDLAASIRREAEAVLAEPALAIAFGAESRAEVAIVGELLTAKRLYAVSGRIDRLVRDSAGWHLLDFKTDRAVPASASEVPPAYVLQLALYRRLLQAIEPGVPVGATLVYTAGPRAIPIPPANMEQALEKRGISGNPVP